LTSTKGGKKILYTANIGDARIVIGRKGKAERLTVDHKASDPEEGKRITDSGGALFNKKIGGTLAVSRAFGDTELKRWGLIAEPYTRKTNVEDGDSHLIVACDGLWDVCGDQEAIDLISSVAPSTSAKQLAGMLLRYALEHGTKDNLTIIVVKL